MLVNDCALPATVVRAYKMPTLKVQELKFSVEIVGDFGINRAKYVRYCILELPDLGWKWRVGPENFEELHGMSRVVRLLPEKISTTGAILDEGCVEECEFLLKLVEDLTTVFVARYYSRAEKDVTPELDQWSYKITSENYDKARLFPEVTPATPSLESTLQDFGESLTRCKREAKKASLEAFWTEARHLVAKSQAIGEACAVFLEVAHPAMINLGKSGLVDWNGLANAELKLNNHLMSLRGMLQDADRRCLS
jgi:hypothetical protein